MRILFDHQAFTIQSRGGISRYVIELGQQLATQPDVDVRLSAGWHRSLQLNETDVDWAHGRYLRPWPYTGPLRHALNYFLTQRDVRRWQPDLVHETYFRTGAPYDANTPTILTVYDLIYFLLPLAGREARRVRQAQQSAIARAAHIICISETTRRDLLRLFPVEAKRISVVPLGRPAERPKSVPAPIRPEINGPYLLHVGLRHSYKNFDCVLQALASSPRLQADFQLVAFGDRPFTDAEVARMRALGLNPENILHRTGDDSLLTDYYAHATAFICPSLYEGFGLPPLEAMAHGCPVVCSDRGALPEITGQAALIFNPDIPTGLAQALSKLVDTPGLANELRMRGYQQTTRFSWTRCAEETLEIYRQVLADKSRR